MKRWFRVLSLLILFLATGCTATLQDANPIPDSVAPPDSTASLADTKLVVLAPTDMPAAWKEQCRKLEASMNIDWIPVNKDDSAAYLDALARKQPPDLILFDSSVLGDLRGLNVFEDLSTPAYGSFSYNAVFPGLSLDAYKSLDGHRLISFPLSLYAKVTFYRSDLLSSIGYPTDPEQVGDLLEDPEEWLQLGLKLKHKGLWMQEQATDGLDILMAGQGFFSEDGSFVRSSGDLVKKLAAVQKAERLGLSAQMNADSENGAKALKAGKYAMLYGPEWKLDALRESNPASSAEWRMTRLPFQAYGPSDALLFAIPSDGRHPDKAWAFAKAWLESGKQTGYPSKAREWSSRFPKWWPTPLDRKADKIWQATIADYLFTGNRTPTQAVATAYAKTIAGLGPDLRILFDEVRRSSK